MVKGDRKTLTPGSHLFSLSEVSENLFCLSDVREIRGEKKRDSEKPEKRTWRRGNKEAV